MDIPMYLDPSRFDCEVNLLQNKVYETFNFFSPLSPSLDEVRMAEFPLAACTTAFKIATFFVCFYCTFMWQQ